MRPRPVRQKLVYHDRVLALNALITIAVDLIALLISVSLHEVAHGRTALALGDTTARDLGRLSLNPIRHIDLFGSLIVPATLAIAHAPVFGWAKPVPVSPGRFAEPRRGMALVSIAGPLTNFGLAAVSLGSLRLLEALVPQTRQAALMDLVAQPHRTLTLLGTVCGFLVAMLVINVVLAVFNLIPIPPLDGAGIVAGFLPEPVARGYERLGPFGFFVIFFLLWIGAFDIVFRPFMALIVTLIAR